MSEALRQVVWKCDRCGGDAQAIFGIFPSCKCGSTSFKAAQPPAPTAQPTNAIEDPVTVPRGLLGAACSALDFGRDAPKTLAELRRYTIGDLSQPVQQPGAEFDHSIGADRFTVRRGSFWWHVRIGGSTSNVGKFHTKLAAEDMALKMLTAYRDGAFEQYQAARAHAAPAQRQPLTQDQILDMADGVSLQFHDLLEFARAIEAAHGITAAPAAQKGEKL